MSVNGRWGHTNDNDWNTPRSAWEEVFPLLDKTKHYWLPFYNDGYCGNIWEENGFDVIHKEEDFWKVMYPGRIVVDNPPYKIYGIVKIKQKIMERLCSNDIPFCLLLPTTTIHTGFFKGLEEKYGKFQLIVPSRKIDFERSVLEKKGWEEKRPALGDIRTFFATTNKVEEEEGNTFLSGDMLSALNDTGEIDEVNTKDDKEIDEVWDDKPVVNTMKSRCPFYTIWICWNMNFPKDMMVV
jgi:hypothetical protein